MYKSCLRTSSMNTQSWCICTSEHFFCSCLFTEVTTERRQLPHDSSCVPLITRYTLKTGKKRNKSDISTHAKVWGKIGGEGKINCTSVLPTQNTNQDCAKQPRLWGLSAVSTKQNWEMPPLQVTANPQLSLPGHHVAAS